MRHTGRIRENESQTLQRMTNSSRKKKKISKNTAYKKGRAFEFRVKYHLEKLGYYVKRSYASKGFEDLIAIKKIVLVSADNSIGNGKVFSEVLILQCKNLKSEKPLSKREIIGLKELANKTGATPIYAYNDKNHKIQMIEI